MPLKHSGLFIFHFIQENVEGIRKELNHLETQMKDNANKVDKIPQTEVEKLKGQFQADVVRLTARLDSLKHV